MSYFVRKSLTQPLYYDNVEVVLQSGHGYLMTKDHIEDGIKRVEIDTFELKIDKLVILKIAADGTCAWSDDRSFTDIIVPGILFLMASGTSVKEIRDVMKEFYRSDGYQAFADRSGLYVNDEKDWSYLAKETFHKGDSAFQLEVYEKGDQVPNKLYTSDVDRTGKTQYDWAINNLSTGVEYTFGDEGITRRRLISQIRKGRTDKIVFLIDAGCSDIDIIADQRDAMIEEKGHIDTDLLGRNMRSIVRRRENHILKDDIRIHRAITKQVFDYYTGKSSSELLQPYVRMPRKTRKSRVPKDVVSSEEIELLIPDERVGIRRRTHRTKGRGGKGIGEKGIGEKGIGKKGIGRKTRKRTIQREIIV